MPALPEAEACDLQVINSAGIIFGDCENKQHVEHPGVTGMALADLNLFSIMIRIFERSWWLRGRDRAQH